MYVTLKLNWKMEVIGGMTRADRVARSWVDEDEAGGMVAEWLRLGGELHPHKQPGT